MSSRTETVETLTELGLTEYESRCFVALTQLSDGTAKEISRVADVPQSRVYDVTEQLHQRGLIDIQESDPRRYFALPPEKAIERFRREYDDYLERAGQQLQALEVRESETDAVWEIADRQDVIVRVIMHVENAEEEVYLLIGDEELLEDDVLEALRGAHDRGISVYAEVPSETARVRLHETDPGIRVAISQLPLESVAVEDRKPGRLLLVDRETVLMSAVTEGLVPDETEETGVWGTEVGHGLVIWLRSLLEKRLQGLEFETA